MRKRVTKAIFPVAGLGARFLPATKAIPKEILPLVDRPLIQYAVDEAQAAGIKELIFVTAGSNSVLEDYFDNDPELVNALRKKGSADLLADLRQTDMESGIVAFVRQRELWGLGHAVACAQQLIANESFAVLLPDDVIDADKPCLKQMIEAWTETGGNMVGVMDVPRDQIPALGVLDIKEDMNRLVSVRGLVKKTDAADEPSCTAVIGRYILTPSVMGSLVIGTPSVGAETQLHDAINAAAVQENNVYGYRFEGNHYDCSSKAGYLEAIVAFALKRPEFRDRFGAYLEATVKHGGGMS
ncbi:MAG: UTP--glucose-1-phosphate uridylyltransferase [Alphaproteobacteria bacterium]|nr:UTP--glucose-1-phosphate uridylyltransferase [Alphaproteobacteria bacterium]